MKGPLARFGYALLFLAVASYAFVTLRGPKGIPALFEKRRQIQHMEERNGSLAKDIERKRERIKRLLDNPGEQEIEIRDRLKLVRPGEKVYIIQQEKK